VRFARLLHDGSEVATTVIDPGQAALTMQQAGQPAGTLTLRLPTVRPDVVVPVVELLLTEDAR
jgi:alpha-L-fucosidase